MADRPILFSGPMVRALLAGTKTQTRRGIVMPKRRGHSEFGRSDTAGYDWHFRDKGLRWHDVKHGRLLELLLHRVGDRLYVRESWQTGMSDNGPQISYRATPDYFSIDAWDGQDYGVGPSFNEDRCPGAKFHHWLGDVLDNDGPWRPGIHMPRWASRLTLTVTEVRVERLQDISEADAQSEGVERRYGFWRCYGETPSPFRGAAPTVLSQGRGVVSADAVHSYATLWDSINGPGSWDANPWVAAYSFTVQRDNIDQQGEPANG